MFLSTNFHWCNDVFVSHGQAFVNLLTLPKYKNSKKEKSLLLMLHSNRYHLSRVLKVVALSHSQSYAEKDKGPTLNRYGKEILSEHHRFLNEKPAPAATTFECGTSEILGPRC